MLTESALTKVVGPEDVRVPIQSLQQKQRHYLNGLLDVEMEVRKAVASTANPSAKARLHQLLADIELEQQEISANEEKVKKGRFHSL
jgi:hypothetical protein